MPSNTPFEVLCADFCAAAHLTTPDMPPDPSGQEGFEATLDGTPMTVLAVTDAGAEHIHVLMEFGLPARPDESRTWQALLDANFAMVSRCGLSFSRNPQTGRVMLQFQMPMNTTTGAALHQNCEPLAKLASKWRRGEIQIGVAGQTPHLDAAAVKSAAFA
ncbi:MAG: CesT family type III secretion system chaperone [Ramlibacter sp.]